MNKEDNKTVQIGLLPCPFCDAHLPDIVSDENNEKRHTIKCTECPGRIECFSSTKEQAIDAWNRREKHIAAIEQHVSATQGDEPDGYIVTMRVGRQEVSVAFSDIKAAREWADLTGVINPYWTARTPAAPVADAIPTGYVLVPMKLTRAMSDAMNEEDWQWEDLLTAAEAITEDQYNQLASEPGAPVADLCDPIEPLPSDLIVETYSPTPRPQWISHTDRGIRITHVPTGIKAERHDDRSQHRNKAAAMDDLRAALKAHAVSSKPSDLHAAIMKLQKSYGSLWAGEMEPAYTAGFEDARHAAAELVASPDAEKAGGLLLKCQCESAEIAGKSVMLNFKESDQAIAFYTGVANDNPTATESVASKAPSVPCTWSLGDWENGIWQSSCGEAWSFIDDGPKENNVRYCHGCGKPVEIKESDNDN